MSHTLSRALRALARIPVKPVTVDTRDQANIIADHLVRRGYRVNIQPTDSGFRVAEVRP